MIGTPGLYKRKCFTKVQFSKRDMGPCDDTLFCQRLNEEGFKIGLVPIVIYDQNNSSFSSTWNRFKWYGTGDYQFYNYNKINWDLRRRISSLLHPFFQTLKYSLVSLKSFKLKCILWNFITMLARYYGWLETFTFSLNKGAQMINIGVIGLGYVGLTLSIVAAKKGFTVYGIDKENHILESLQNKKAHFYEKGLDVMLSKVFNKNFYL